MTDSFIAVDLETTGLQPKSDRILEIGALKVIGGEIEETFATFIDPRMRIPERITELTGITQEMVSGQPQNEEAVERFLEFAGDLPLLGHNILFDYSFLKHQAANMRMEFERSACDTLAISRKAFPGLPSRSLESMCAYYRIERACAHRAFDDAKASLELFGCLRREFGESHPEWFEPKELIYRVKRQSPITAAQKRYLKDLMKYHKIETDAEVDSLTKNEASRLIDSILSTCGKIEK